VKKSIYLLENIEMIINEFKQLIVSNFQIGQSILFKKFDLNLFKEFQENISTIKGVFKSLNLDEELEKVISEIDSFSEKDYTINGREKLFYFFAAFRTHGLKFLTKNTYEHKVKRYIFDVNFKLDYVQNSIEII